MLASSLFSMHRLFIQVFKYKDSSVAKTQHQTN